jgi:hypothetical protein
MHPIMKTPHLTFKEDEQKNPAIFWVNPYNGQEEVIARLYWPTHPPEKTEEAEKLWERIGKTFANALNAEEERQRMVKELGCHPAFLESSVSDLSEAFGRVEEQRLRDEDEIKRLRGIQPARDPSDGFTVKQLRAALERCADEKHVFISTNGVQHPLRRISDLTTEPLVGLETA